MQDDTSTVTELKETIRQFVDEREWRQFHTPKDLAVGLSIEAAELLEHFRFRKHIRHHPQILTAHKNATMSDLHTPCVIMGCLMLH